MNPLWLSQTWAVMRLELRKSFFNRRSFWIYLLALAVANNARFVTFDRNVSLRAVVGATAAHLVML